MAQSNTPEPLANMAKCQKQLALSTFGSVCSAGVNERDRLLAVRIQCTGRMDAQDIEQFIREARAFTQLNHPNIVRVRAVGREGDRIYVVTDFVQGVILADWLTDQRTTPHAAAELCVTVADALHHAHQHGVIHRCLKLSNIMLDTEGKPHLIDFGMVKRHGREFIPEWARGDDADGRGDVYLLGVVLFELLTGQRPFRDGRRMLLYQLLSEDAPSPRSLNRAVPRDLEAVCLKCLEKNSANRYLTAAELREDLKRFLSGEPVHARPINKVERVWRWCRRRSWWLYTSCVVVSSLF